MSDKKQTAVEWLDSNLIHAPYTQEDFTYNYRVFEQAKSMEKDQEYEIKAYWFGRGILAGNENRISELKPTKDGEHQQGFELEADHYYQNIYGTDQGIEKNPNQEASN